jgi:hypothetical protein
MQTTHRTSTGSGLPHHCIPFKPSKCTPVARPFHYMELRNSRKTTQLWLEQQNFCSDNKTDFFVFRSLSFSLLPPPEVT